MSEKWPNLIWGADSAPPPPTTQSGAGLVTYRVALANRGLAGLGSVIISDIFTTIGVPKGGNQLSFVEELNGAGSCSFALPIDHSSVTKTNFKEGARELHVYRNDGNGEILVWAGRLWVTEIQGWFVRMVGYGWFFDLTRRHVVADYTSQISFGVYKDQFTVVRDLIDATQARTNGQLGFTHYDTSLSGTTRNFVVCAEERRAIADIITEFTEADDGFDIAVLPDKKVRMWTPRRQSNSGLTFSAEVTGQVEEFSFQRDGAEIATDVAAVGPDEECAKPAISVVSDATAQAEFGILDERVDANEIIHAPQRLAMAREELRNSKAARWQPEVQIATGLGTDTFYQYNVGDTVTVLATRGPADGFGQFNQSVRILSRTVDVSTPGVEKITLGLDSVIA